MSRTPEEHRAITDEIARKQREASAKNKANNTHKSSKKRTQRGSARARANTNVAITKKRFYPLERFARE